MLVRVEVVEEWCRGCRGCREGFERVSSVVKVFCASEGVEVSKVAGSCSPSIKLGQQLQSCFIP